MEKTIKIQVGLNDEQIKGVFKSVGIEASEEKIKKLKALIGNALLLSPALEECLQILLEEVVLEEWSE